MNERISIGQLKQLLSRFDDAAKVVFGTGEIVNELQRTQEFYQITERPLLETASEDGVVESLIIIGLRK